MSRLSEARQAMHHTLSVSRFATTEQLRQAAWEFEAELTAVRTERDALLKAAKHARNILLELAAMPSLEGWDQIAAAEALNLQPAIQAAERQNRNGT